MNSLQSMKMSNKPKSNIASKIPTSGRDSGTHSRSSSVSNLTTASDLHSEVGDTTCESTEEFKIDEKVWVNGTKPGQIKFVGKTQFAPGVWAGVLLDEPVGKNDGSVAGIKYFTCDPLRGIFARPSKLTRTPGAVPAVCDASMIGTLTTPPKSTNVPSSRSSVSSTISTPSPKYTKLKVGDQITVSSLSGLKSGTLRYIGETDFAKGEWAGIELDEPTGKNDGSVAGKRYFTCELKYGLFAPLHKVSRPGATPFSRPGSVRGTPLLRSSSRDSINSSVSNSSRTSRVKLGITSLTSAQKIKVPGNMGITSTTKAFEEAIKEKDQHIEQLLKERDLNRAEFAKLASLFEELEVKSAELEKRQKIEEFAKKSADDKLVTLQKKLEDIQFQLEEEKITKADFETQLQQRYQILKNIEEYVSKDSSEKFLNIKEILSGQEALTEISHTKIDFKESEQLRKKTAELEDTVKIIQKEKSEILNQLTNVQKYSDENSTKNESAIKDLNAVVQEKDNIITNLKNELNKNSETVTHLNEQILMKEEQAKSHADDIIKELGEKINSLSEQLKTQSSQLAEHAISIEDKDNKITSLEHSLKDKANALAQLQNEHKLLNDALKLKESQYEENIGVQKSLQEEAIALKSQLENNNNDNQKKINLLEEEISTKSNLLSNYLSSMEEKENLISSLQQNFDSQAAALIQLQNEKKDLNDSLNQKELLLGEKLSKLKSLEEQLSVLSAQCESNASEKDKKMIDLVKEIERLTISVQEKEEQLLKSQNELSQSKTSIETLNETIQQLSEKMQIMDNNLVAANKDAAERIKNLQNEISTSTQEKSDIKTEFEREVDVLKTAIKVQEDELQSKSDIITQHESQISLLTENLKKSDEKCLDLIKDIEQLSEKNKNYITQTNNFEALLKSKDEVIVDFEKQIEGLKGTLDKNKLDLENSAKQLESLQADLNLKEEDNNQMISKLQLAEQKVEMLNKNSSDHVLALQNEMTKIKEESTTTKTHLEQELCKFKKENEKLVDVIKEKDASVLEKEEKLTSVEKKLKEKESEVSDLSSQKIHILEDISKYSADIEAAKKKEEKLSNTLSEYETKLSDKEKELISAKANNEKLSSSLSEKEKALFERDETITSFQNKLKSKEAEISELSSQNTDLLKNISKFGDDIEEGQKLYNEKLTSSITEFETKLNEKDRIIQDTQNELENYKNMLDSKSKELNNKNGEVDVLKSIIQEKESQFDEVSKMVELSQNKLALLKEQNEKNECILQSKEKILNDFKADQEKQLQLKEQFYKEEINSKEAHISSMLADIEEKKKVIESLQKKLEVAKSDKEKMSVDSSNVYDELNNKILELETKYLNILEEKEKIAKEELQTRDAKKNLELVRDTLLQEKCAQEEMVKDKEAKLEALQVEVNRMQAEFTKHKQELQQKLDVSDMELQASLELKNQLDIQHKVLEELHQELQKSEENRKNLEAQVQRMSVISSDKDQLQAQVDEFQKINRERSEMIAKMEEKHKILEEQLNNNKNLTLQKEKELCSLKEQLQKLPCDKVSLDVSLKSLEEENFALKNKITVLEKKTDTSNKTATEEISPEEADEKQFLLSQIDFLNSIIVDLKQKNEKLSEQLEAQTTCWEESDVNLNETKKAIAPRLYCDICEVFDLHDTDECPKQESCAEEAVPQLRLSGSRQLEERPYCNNCEVFGHWTLDCDEPDTF